MPLFNVHLYPVVRVKFSAIPADDAKDAFEQAERRYRYASPTNGQEIKPSMRLRGAGVSEIADVEEIITEAVVDPLDENGEPDLDESTEFHSTVDDNGTSRHNLTRRQLAAVLAGLRLAQRLSEQGHDLEEWQEIATDGGTIEPLVNEEIDNLCERLNIAGPRSKPIPEGWRIVDTGGNLKAYRKDLPDGSWLLVDDSDSSVDAAPQAYQWAAGRHVEDGWITTIGRAMTLPQALAFAERLPAPKAGEEMTISLRRS